MRDITDDAGFTPILWSESFSLDAYLAPVPRRLTVKGMFFLDLQKSVGVSAIPGTFVAFKGYPLEDWMRALVKAAGTLYPHEPTRQGLRLLGRMATRTFFESSLGRVFSALFSDPTRGIDLLRRGLSVLQSYGSIVESPRPDGVVYRISQMWDFVDSQYVGILEQGAAQFRVNPTVTIRRHAVDSADIRLTWAPPRG
jgi:uncharacterized protein (TIGR02265 family)